MNHAPKENGAISEVDIQDVLAAMQEAGGYLDITPADALALYRVAYAHAFDRLRRGVRVRHVMSSPVVTVAADAPLAEAAQRMAQNGVSGVPVLDNGELAGVLSIKDFLVQLGLPKNASAISLVAELVAGRFCLRNDLAGVTVREIMSAPAMTIGLDATIADAAASMGDAGINRLPVLDGGRLAGLVTRSDVVLASRLCVAGDAA